MAAKKIRPGKTIKKAVAPATPAKSSPPKHAPPAKAAPAKGARAATSKRSSRSLKLATFNINGLRSRLEQLLAWLEKESPDVVCLQELKTLDFPRAELERAGYRGLWKGQKSWNGVAILAKGAVPVETRRELPGAPDDEQSRYLEAAVHGILIACVYLPNGNPQPGPKFDYKLRWFERLIEHAQGLYDSGHPVALIGDFNVVPTDFDIYNTRSWLKDALLQPESRERFQRLLAQGWQDVLRAQFPDQRVYTFWDYFRQAWARNAGLRIDHVLASASLAARVTAAASLRLTFAPVCATLVGRRRGAARPTHRYHRFSRGRRRHLASAAVSLCDERGNVQAQTATARRRTALREQIEALGDKGLGNRLTVAAHARQNAGVIASFRYGQANRIQAVLQGITQQVIDGLA